MMSTALPLTVGSPSASLPAGGERLTIGARVAIGMLVVWSVSQIVVMIPTLPDEFRGPLLRVKSLIGPMVLLLIALISKASLSRVKLFWPMLIFSAYSAFNLMVRSDPNWQRAALSMAWAGCFVIIPGLLYTRYRMERFLAQATLAIFAALSLAVVMSISDGDYSVAGGGRTRFHFGMNPNYFAALASCLACAGFASLVLTPHHRRPFAWLCLISGCVLTFLTDGRTHIVGLLAVFVVYAAYAKGVIARAAQLLLVLTGALFVAIAAFMASPLFGIEEMNSISSGRVLVWYSALKSNLGSGELLPLIWGQTNVSFDMSDAQWRVVSHMRYDAFDSATEVKVGMTRVSFDNAYLDILLMTGVIGLVLVLWAWFGWWRGLRPQRGEPLEARRMKGVVRGILAGLLVTALFSSPWPAMGNVSISFGLVLAIALTTILNSEHAWGEAETASPKRPEWNPPGRIR